MIRQFAIATLAAALTFGLVACKDGATSLTTTVNMTQADIQTKVSTKFPINKVKDSINITLSNPKVKLDGASQRLVMTTDVLIKLPNKKVGPRGREVNPPPLTGNAVVNGVINYDKTTGIVYFEKGKLQDLNVDQLPAEIESKVKATAATQVESQLAKMEIFKLDEAKLEQAAAKALLQGIKVTEGALAIEVGYK